LLDGAEGQSLRDHLAGCPACQSALEQARAQQRLFASAARQTFPAMPDLSEENCMRPVTIALLRSTPTVDGDLVYGVGGYGDLVCAETATGTIVWHKHLEKDFQGNRNLWAYTESPLLDGDTLVCTPGGATATTGSVRCYRPASPASCASRPACVRLSRPSLSSIRDT